MAKEYVYMLIEENDLELEKYSEVIIVTKDKEIPYMALETSYSSSDIGQVKTRISAFIEML